MLARGLMWALALLPAVLELASGYEVVSALAWEYVAWGLASALKLESVWECLGLVLDLQSPGTPH